MTLRVHHLNCGSMREIEPNDGPLSPLRPARAVCHCLLIVTPTSGLVLVETGLGSAAIERPQEVLGDEFLGRAQPRTARPAQRPERGSAPGAGFRVQVRQPIDG